MYNFTDAPNRKNMNCVKWDNADASYGGQNLLPMWIADMDFQVAPPIVEALRRRVDHMVYGYDFLGDDYYDAICSWMKRRHNFDIKREWITFTPGIVTALHIATLALSQPGDEIIVNTPAYGPFFGAVKDEGRTMVDVPLKVTDGNYEMDFDALERAITPKTRAIMFCSPHNPSGRVWTMEELKKLDALCEKHNIVVVADEIHHDLVLSGKHISYGCVSEHAKNNCIICTAPSKTFNLAGIQVSNIIIPNDGIREKFNVQVKRAHLGANNFAGPALIAAYNESEKWLEELLEVIRGNCQYLVDYITKNIPEIKVKMPEGTYLLWLDCRGLGLKEEDLGKFFAEKCGLAANVGSWFGDCGTCFRRINTACPRSFVEECAKRIEAGVKTLRK